MLDVLSSLTGGGGLSNSSSASAGGNSSTSRGDTNSGIQFGNDGLPAWVIPVTAAVVVLGLVWIKKK